MFGNFKKKLKGIFGKSKELIPEEEKAEESKEEIKQDEVLDSAIQGTEIEEALNKPKSKKSAKKKKKEEPEEELEPEITEADKEIVEDAIGAEEIEEEKEEVWEEKTEDDAEEEISKEVQGPIVEDKPEQEPVIEVPESEPEQVVEKKVDVAEELQKTPPTISKLFGRLRKKKVKAEQAIEAEIGAEVSAEEGAEKSAKKKKLGLLEKVTKKALTEKQLDPLLWDLEVALLENDVAKEVSEKITAKVKQDLLDTAVSRKSIESVITDSLKGSVQEILGQEKPDLFKLIKDKDGPFTIIFCGFNGTGKTMTIGKFAKMLKDKGFSVVLAAGDTFRAAAIEQLEVHAEKVGVPIIKQQRGSDSAAVIFDAIAHAKSKEIDVVLADTAGRASTNTNLMDELAKVVKVNKPDFKIFVGDSLTGNDAAEQARVFDEAVGIDGSVLTKIDTDAKGGSCLSVSYITGRPILYLGTGQDYPDMVEFTPEWFMEKVF